MRSDTVRVVVTMHPKANKIDDLQSLLASGLQYHQDLPTCLKWALTRQIGPDDGAEVLITIEEWETPGALKEHGESSYAVKTIMEMGPLMEKMEVKMSKVICGFD